MNAGRGGFALVFSLLMVAALAILAMGTMAVGVREEAVAGAVARRAEAVRTAEGAAARAVARWSTRAVADLGTGEERVLVSSPRTLVTAVRLDTSLFMVRGEARVPGPAGSALASAGLLVRVLDPASLARALPGALTASGPVDIAGGFVEGPDTCGGPAPGVVAPAVAVGPTATVTGDPPVRLTPAPAPPRPDPFGPTLASVLADIRHPGLTAAPRPAIAGGTCAPDPRNWGSADPGHPCHGLRPVVTAGDLTVTGGEAHGVLVVHGNLRVTAGARLSGVIVVRGRLVVEGGSTLRGAVRAGEAVVSDGAILRDGCALSDALSAPAFDRAFRPPSRWWLPAF